MGEDKLEQRCLQQLVVFLQFLKKTSINGENSVEDKEEELVKEGEETDENKDKCNEGSEKKIPDKILKSKPKNLPWLNDRSWKYFLQFEEEFTELQGNPKITKC